MQAKIEHQKKAAAYGSASLKYWNRETQYTRGKDRIGMGLSRTKSDAYSKALFTLGKGRKAYESLYKAYSAKQLYDDGTAGRSTKFGLAQYKALLDKQASIQNTINNTFGRNMDIVNQSIQRDYLSRMAKNRAALGVRPEYGAPVFMPPKDRAGQMFANIQLGLQIAQLGVGLAGLPGGGGNITPSDGTYGTGIPSNPPTGNYASDIRLKENIVKVGKALSGLNIYEWNYKSAPNSRYRGVMAQEVIKIFPEAIVKYIDGFLGVRYDLIDVNMELIK